MSRRVIVHIAISADGYIARPDGDVAWLTSRPKPPGFYGLAAFTQSIDTKLMGRKTYDGVLRDRAPERVLIATMLSTIMVLPKEERAT